MGVGASIVVSLVATGAQMIYDNEQKNKAESRARAARNRAAGISEANPFEAVQAPDVSRLAFEQTSQSEADALRAAQDLGEAGAAQVTNIVKAGRDQKLKAAQEQAKLEYERDTAEASAEAGIEARKAAREYQTSMQDYQQNMAAAQAYQDSVVGGVGSLFQGAGALAVEAGDYYSPESKAERAAGRAAKNNPALGTDKILTEGTVKNTGVENNPFIQPNNLGLPTRKFTTSTRPFTPSSLSTSTEPWDPRIGWQKEFYRGLEGLRKN
tara:strand:- start:2730 stop:3533 length:804 start_codon:yes stop_codon:yes gene_type:complete